MQLGCLAIVRSTILTTEHFFRFYVECVLLHTIIILFFTGILFSVLITVVSSYNWIAFLNV